MQLRRFGRTNLNLSAFSLGTMRFLTADDAAQTVLRAAELGINHLETAQAYGDSEKYLGQALQQCADFYITSKLMPTLDADEFERAIDRSLQRLDTDHLDCLAIHGLNTWEHLNWIETPQGCMAAAQRAVADGRVRHVGFSTHAPLEVILRAIATDQFEFVNLHYYYFNQRNLAAVEAAHARDLGVLIISPADKGGMLHQPPQTLVDLCQPLTPLELTYRFLLSDARITTLSFGAATPDQLEVLAQYSDSDLTATGLTEAETAALDRLQFHLAKQLASERCSQCYACLPCPEAINIPEVLRLRNLAVAYDMTEFGQYRYRMFENAGHWFPGRKANRCTDCGDCLPRCPEGLAIPTLLRDAHDRLNGPARRRLWE